MKSSFTPWSGGTLLMTAMVLAALCQSATAAVATWKGQTLDAKLASDAEVRLSLIGFTDADKGKAVVDQYQQYLTNHNEEMFDKFLQQQDTKGYLFTKEAVGYTIKYAWQAGDAVNKRMVLLVTPALKTRNPYQWKQQNSSSANFTLVEAKFAGDEVLLSTSLDTPIEVSGQGQLQLKASDQSSVFATLKDDTPYYLKSKS